MVIIISGCSHTGKTALAQKLLEKYKYPYLSIDLLKMGLIRSGQTSLTPEDDDLLTEYLWPIVREMINTAVENKQNLIAEGCYVPFDWMKDFAPDYLKEIRAFWLIMSSDYIEKKFADIKDYANVIEARIDDRWCTKEMLLSENQNNLAACQKYGCEYLMIDKNYDEVYKKIGL